MIKAIIFDLGDVFIDLGIEKSQAAFRQMGLVSLDDDLVKSNAMFEVGNISEHTFLTNIQNKIPSASLDEIRSAWNLVIGDFPRHRLDFLITLSQSYPLFLMSNTDAIHIKYFIQKVGGQFYKDFENCFQKVYFSFEMGLRKPDSKIFEIILSEQSLVANETLFVDDKFENIEAAKKLGIRTWHLQVGKEDVVSLDMRQFYSSNNQ